MAEPTVICMTLTGPLKGKNIILNRHKFVDGETEFTGTPEQAENVARYFTRCYQVKVKTLSADEAKLVEEIVAEEVEDNEAVREDDLDVLGDEEEMEINENDPNDRQAAIIAAVNGIDREKWIEKETNPHPKVKDVAVLMEDPTVTKAEICEVIEKWLS